MQCQIFNMFKKLKLHIIKILPFQEKKQVECNKIPKTVSSSLDQYFVLYIFFIYFSFIISISYLTEFFSVVSFLISILYLTALYINNTEINSVRYKIEIKKEKYINKIYKTKY